jgi:predicted aspartyl protease
MLERREFLGLAAAFTMVSCATSPRVAQPLAYPLKLVRGNRQLIETRVNGHVVEALLDSAAEASFIDRAFARSVGLVDTESVQAKGSGEKNFAVPLAKGVKLSAAGITLRDQTIAISDLADVGQRLLGQPLQMILGRELFDAARLRIDIARRELQVLSDAAEPRGVRFQLTTVNGIEVFPVRVEGEDVLAALDTGNGSQVLVGAKYAQRRGFLGDGRPVTQEKGGGLGGETLRSIVPLRSLEIAGLTLTNVPGAIDEGDSATDLNVGMSVLRYFVITTDFRQHALWLEPAQG